MLCSFKHIETDRKLMQNPGPQGRGPALRRGMRVTLRGACIEGIGNHGYVWSRVRGRVVARPKHKRFVVILTDAGYRTTAWIDKQGRMID